MGCELSQYDIVDKTLSDKEFFGQLQLVFSYRIDSYRDFRMDIYQHVVKNLDVLLALSREISSHFFLDRCTILFGEYYTIEIFTRLREVSDLIEWLANEYGIVACGVTPLLLQHQVFFVEPPLEAILKNLERMVKWYKRYQKITLSPDIQLQRFVYSFQALSEKVKMIY